MRFTGFLLDFLPSFSYNRPMFKSIKKPLNVVVKNSDFDRLSFPKSTNPRWAFSFNPWRTFRFSKHVAGASKKHSSGFAVASRCADYAASLWLPGTHPHLMRSAVF